MKLEWPTLNMRVQDGRILGLRYDPESGYVVVELDDGEPLVSADWDGCCVVLERPRS